MKKFAAIALVIAALSGAAPAQDSNVVHITVDAAHPGAKINPAMWGIFFEDINFGADGGLFAEMVENRGFEFPDPMMGWTKISPSTAKGKLIIRDSGAYNAKNPHYLRIQSEGTAPFGVANGGFRGMGVKSGEDYDFSSEVRQVSGSNILTLRLYGDDGSLLDSARLTNLSSSWRKQTATLHPTASDSKARLCILLEGKGTVDVDIVSLFPRHTWNDRPGGLRADLVQMLADLKPGFMRFPGGCVVEGSQLDRRYQWKNTIGPVDERPLLVNRWNYEFIHRPAPDYYQSFGLGFFEYFQLCEDIGAEPLPILNCGMACQFNTAELVPLKKLGPFIQDALDLIEFANGPATSTWGAKRSAMGHPDPFHLKMLGVGNEQWGSEYLDRYTAFAKVLKQRHPEISLVAAAGPGPSDESFQTQWPKLRDLKADIIDEHCYANPIWFLGNAGRYDNYDPAGPKVFMGEYAAQSVAIVSPKNRNNLECALAEAAYMTGLERNAAVVRMASYAPLFGNVEAWQWTPNLIWTDSSRVYPTPDYYVQQMFMNNRGDSVLPAANDAPFTSVSAGGVGIGSSQAAAEFKELRVTHGNEVAFLNGLPTNNPTVAREWTSKDGQFTQSNPHGGGRVFLGDTNWRDYTLSLKARKTGGDGELVFYIRANGPEEYLAWHVGGWGNGSHGLVSHLGLQDNFIGKVPGTITNGRWYDVQIRLNGEQVSCYLDGQLAQSATVPARRTPSLFTSATRDDKTGEIIVKAVNPGERETPASIHLEGVNAWSVDVGATILTGDKLAGENSLDDPRHIAPISSGHGVSQPDLAFTFKPRSFTVLRILPPVK